MKNVPENNKLICLNEYKEGFGELIKLVNGFEGIAVDSQILFLSSMEDNLNDQLKLLDIKKNEVLAEVKKFLASYNSQFKALLDTEEFILGQIEHYRAQRKVITNENTSEPVTEEKSAV